MPAPIPPPDSNIDDDSTADDSTDALSGSNTHAAHPNDPNREPGRVELVALVDDTAEGRQATICPARANATDLVTTWLTVDANHLLDLDDWR